MKSKLKSSSPSCCCSSGAARTSSCWPSRPPEPKPKVDGAVYVLPKEFLVNLADGRFAKLTSAWCSTIAAAPAAGGHGAAAPPEGYGVRAQEAIIRDLITDASPTQNADDLISREGREKIKKQILKRMKKKTDVKVEDVLFTDVTVQ